MPLFTDFWHSASVNFGSCTEVILISSHSNWCHVVRQQLDQICFQLCNSYIKIEVSKCANSSLLLLHFQHRIQRYIFPIVECQKFPTASLIMFSVVQQLHLTPCLCQKNFCVEKDLWKTCQSMFTFEHCKITPLAVCNHYVVSVEMYACS